MSTKNDDKWTECQIMSDFVSMEAREIEWKKKKENASVYSFDDAKTKREEEHDLRSSCSITNERTTHSRLNDWTKNRKLFAFQTEMLKTKWP